MAVQTACFVIADISGYTSYLAGVELDHADDILADLIDTVVQTLRPPFRLAKLEGDAAFVYSIADTIEGSLLQDTIEATYFAFRRRLRDIKAATRCQCDACRRMGTLDLKFVVHYGQMLVHSVAGSEELVGRDVILVHRLLKNSAGDQLDGRAYALFSDDCIAAMTIDPREHSLIVHHEMIDVIGDTKTWIRDLEAAWRTETERQRVFVTRQEAALVVEGDVAAPRSLVWEYCALPEHRPKWQGSQGVRETTADGRRGTGTQNHCAHGANTVVEHILDWRPFDYMSLTSQIDLPGSSPLTMTIAFHDLPDGGTRLEVLWAKPADEAQAFFDMMRPILEKSYRDSIVALGPVLEGLSAGEAAIDEPPLPRHAERFLTEPVTQPTP